MKMDKKNNLFLSITLIILVTFLLIKVIYFSEPEKEDHQIKTTSKKEAINNWKTYNNTTYGYELKYPENWFLNTEKADREIYCTGPDNESCYGGFLSISNYKNPDQYEQHSLDQDALEKPTDFIKLDLSIRIEDDFFLIDNLCKRNPGQNILNREKIIINGIDAINCSSVTVDHPADIYIDSTTIKNNDKIFQLGYEKNGPKDKNESIEKIISTFTLIK